MGQKGISSMYSKNQNKNEYQNCNQRFVWYYCVDSFAKEDSHAEIEANKIFVETVLIIVFALI